MNNRELAFILKARDEFSATWKKVAGTVKSQVQTMKTSFTSLGGIIRVALAGAAIRAVIQASNEQEQALAKVGAAIRSTGGAAGVTSVELQHMAADLQKVTEYGDEVILRGQSLLLTFTAIGKDVFPQATETMLNMATAMGTDVKDAAIQLGKALQDPVLGAASLRRVGVNLSLSQMETIKSMVAMNNVAGAQALILKELEVEFGGLARATGATGAGRLKIFANAWGDVQEQIGTALKEGLLPFLENLQDIMPYAKPVIATLVGGFTAVFKTIQSVSSGFKTIVAGFTWLGDRSKENAVAFLSQAKDFQQSYRELGDIGRNIRQAWAEMDTKFKESNESGVGALRSLNSELTINHSTQKALNATIAEHKKGLEDLMPGSAAYIQQLIVIERLQSQLNATLRASDNLMKDVMGKTAVKEIGKVHPAMITLNKDFDWAATASAEFASEVALNAQNSAAALGALSGALGTGFEAAFSGASGAGRTFMKSLLTGFIDMVQGLILAAEAASLAKAVGSWGVTLIKDLPLLLAATAGLQAARALVNTKFHQGGSMFIDAPASQDVPVSFTARGQERITVTPMDTGQKSDSTTVIININAPFAPVDYVKRIIQEGLRQTGKTVDQYLVNPATKRYRLA